MRELTHEQMLTLVARAWGKQEGYAFFPWIRGTSKNREERIKSYREGPAFLWPTEKEAILHHMAEHKGDDLYWCPSLFERKRRSQEFAMDEHALWADLDETDPRTIEDYPPTAAWESSPGRYQALWLLQPGSGDLQGASWQGGENQRLTYHVGADVAGWDTTQLLRFPGWNNHKFEYWKGGKPGSVRGQLLWSRRRLYMPDDFEELPEIPKTAEFEDILEDQIAAVDIKEVWGRVRLKLPTRTRELIRAKDTSGDRSETLWQIERDLADAGCTAVEIVAIVRSSVWNKFEGRQDELKRLTIEAGKAIAARPAKVERKIEQEREDKPDAQDLFTLLANIQPPRWLVQDIWTEGACGFIAGQPKTFKSWSALDLGLSVATGIDFLDRFRVVRPGPVLYIQEEDGAPTIKDRVNKIWPAKQADRVAQENGKLVWLPKQEGVENPKIKASIRQGFVLSDEGWQAWLDEQLEKGYEGEPYRMLIIDPLMMVAGDVDETRAQQMTELIFKPLRTLAGKFEIAIPVVHHMRKGTQYRGGRGQELAYERGGQMMLGSVANHAWADDALYVRLTKQGIHVELESKNASSRSFTVSNLRSNGWNPRASKIKEMFEETEKESTNGNGHRSNGNGKGNGKVHSSWEDKPQDPVVEKAKRVMARSKSPVLQGLLAMPPGRYTADEIAGSLEYSPSAQGVYQQLRRLTNLGVIEVHQQGRSKKRWSLKEGVREGMEVE